MNLVDAVKSVFTNYFNFKGRASRSEFWHFSVFYIIVSIAITSLFDQKPVVLQSFGIVDTVFYLATVVPRLSLTWRRLHDTGHTGWEAVLVYAVLVPLIYTLFMSYVLIRVEPKTEQYGFFWKTMMVAIPIYLIRYIVLLLKDSEPSENEYGPNPKEKNGEL